MALLLCVALAFVAAAAARDNSNNSNAANENANTGNANNTNTGNANARNANTGNANNTNTSNTNNGNVNNGSPTPSPTPSPAATNECGQTPHQKSEEWKKGAKLEDLKVVGVTRADAPNESERKEAGLYNTICVQVDNLAAWVEADPKNDPRKLFLYLDTYPLTAIRGRQVGRGSNFLHFDLQQTSDKETQENWRNILSRPALFPTKSRPVPVSLGYDATPGTPDASESPISTEVTGTNRFQLVDVNSFWFKIFLVFILGALALFFWLAWVSDLLREDGPRPEGLDKNGKPNRRPFSLGRTQMAFWFFIVIVCYVFIWMVTSSGNTLTPTVLGLIGISAATALGSVFITNSKDEEGKTRRAEYEAERDSIQARIDELEARKTGSPPLTGDEASELASLRKRLYKVKQLLAGASRGFFQDIVSDADGVGFHRFQIIAWTVALGFIFLAQVFNYLTMPDFDATLLGLMGISSGTYLGFKFPEKQVS